MRLKLTLECRPGTYLPRDTHYPLSSAIYNLLAKSDPDYATFLHTDGYRGEKRRYKPFTFSWLYAAKRRSDPRQPAFHIIDSPTLDWFISSPLDAFLQNLVTGFFEAGGVRVHQERFRILTVETLPPPVFGPSMRFTCLSPFIFSTQRDDRSIEYLKEDGPRLDEAITKNLQAKHELLTDEKITGALHLEISPRYKAKHDRLTKTLTIKGGQAEQTTLVGIMAPFTLSGPPALIQTAYDCGLGEHTAQGCGMIELEREPAAPGRV